MRRGPTHTARNYSKHAEIQFAHVQQGSARSSPDVICRTHGLRMRRRLPAETQLAQFGLAFGLDQPNNRG